MRALLVDASGVLLLPDPDVMRSVLRPFGVEPEDALLEFAHYVGVLASDRAAAGADAVLEHRRAYASAVGVSRGVIEDAAIAVGLAQVEGETWSCGVRDATSVVGSLAESIPTAVVANADPGLADRLRTHGMDGAVVVASGVEGLAKPDPAIFRLALSRLGATGPSGAIHIGDSVLADVHPALSLGMAALHFDPHYLCPEGAHRHLRGWADLRRAEPSLGAVADGAAIRRVHDRC